MFFIPSKTAARDVTFQFSSEVNIKHMDVSLEVIQQAKTLDRPKTLDLDVIPELAPGNPVKKFVSLTPTKLGQIALEAKVSYTDIWSLKQTKAIISWISVFKPASQSRMSAR